MLSFVSSRRAPRVASIYGSVLTVLSLALLTFLRSHAAESRSVRHRESGGRPNVLVIGGTGFIGRETVAHLIDTGAFHLSFMTRGRIHNPHPPSARHIVCDKNADCFGHVLLKEGPWAAVIDFVGFEVDNIKSILYVAPRLVGLYVFISAASVYEACHPSRWRHDTATGLLLETSAARTCSSRASCQALERLRACNFAESSRECSARVCSPYTCDDGYGSNKLSIEEALERADYSRGLRWTSLRLPDVVGPHESTGRQADLSSMIADGADLGLLIDGTLHDRFSVVTSSDVARAVLAVLTAAPLAEGEAFNIATSSLEWREFVRLWAEEMRAWRELHGGPVSASTVSPPHFNSTRAAPRALPSLHVGGLSIEKSMRRLDWQPSSLRLGIRQAVAWQMQQPTHSSNLYDRPLRFVGDSQSDPEQPSRLEAARYSWRWSYSTSSGG